MTPIPNHRAYALGLFRSSVFFIVAVTAFAQKDRHTQTILLTLVFLIDVASWHLCQVILLSGNSVYNRQWHDTLADRIFVESVLSKARDGFSIYPETLRRESIQAATADVKQYLEDETIWFKWGGFRKTLLSIGHFVWFWVSYGIFYGLAMTIGTAAQ